MKIIESCFEKLIFPFLLLMLTPLVTVIVSKLKTGDWFKWYTSISTIYKVIFIGIIVLWILIIFLNQRKNKLKRSLVIMKHSYTNFIKSGEIQYEDVFWLFGYPDSIRFAFENIKSSDIIIQTPPRCPKCKTELKENITFFGKHLLTCIACGYNKKNKKSSSSIAEDVKKIVKREIEKQYEKNENRP